MKMRYRQALNLALREEMQRDDGVILVGEDIGLYQGSHRVTEGLLEEFGPTRVIDTPISESGFVGFCVGAAMTGMRPVAELMLQGLLPLAMEPLVNQASNVKSRLGGQVKCPLVVRAPSGVRPWGGPVNNQNLDSLLFSVPGLQIAMPSTPRDARGLLKAAIRDDDPVLFFEHTSLYVMQDEVPEAEEVIPLGEGIVRRPGSDVTVVSISEMVLRCMTAAAELEANDGINAEVIDLRTLYPLDVDLVLESVQKTRRLLVVQEAPLVGGWGGEVVAAVSAQAFDSLDAAPTRLGAKRFPAPSAEQFLREVYPQPETIVDAVRALCVGGRARSASSTA